MQGSLLSGNSQGLSAHPTQSLQKIIMQMPPTGARLSKEGSHNTHFIENLEIEMSCTQNSIGCAIA